MDIKLIRIVAPPTPACFHDRLSWTEYLGSAMDSKAHRSGHVPPFIDGRFNEAFSHCIDCLHDHRREMCAQGRCHPPVTPTTRKSEAQSA